MESVEDAERTLEEARLSAEPAVQIQLNQIQEDLKLIKESIQKESLVTDGQKQNLVRDWGVSSVSENQTPKGAYSAG